MADDEWKALMYGDDEDEEEHVVAAPKSEVLPERGIINMPAMSAELRRARGTLDAQERLIKRLEQRVRNVERRLIAMGGDLRGMTTELDAKIDRRD